MIKLKSNQNPRSVLDINPAGYRIKEKNGIRVYPVDGDNQLPQKGGKEWDSAGASDCVYR